jgi:hypothetical protein
MASGPSQHYTFCHRALPSIFFRDPGWLFAVINGADCQRFLDDVWTRAGEHSPAEGRRGGEGLRGEAFVDGPYLFALIHLPAPAEPAEGHFAAAVAGFADPDNPSIDALAWARFFTLERGVDYRTEEACTFLCEWTREGLHRNLGGGPEAQPGAFVAAVLQCLASEPPPVASSQARGSD